MTVNYSNYQTCSFWNAIRLLIFGKFKCKRCKNNYKMSLAELQLKDHCYDCAELVASFEEGYFTPEYLTCEE